MAAPHRGSASPRLHEIYASGPDRLGVPAAPARPRAPRLPSRDVGWGGRVSPAGAPGRDGAAEPSPAPGPPAAERRGAGRRERGRNMAASLPSYETGSGSRGTGESRAAGARHGRAKQRAGDGGGWVCAPLLGLGVLEPEEVEGNSGAAKKERANPQPAGGAGSRRDAPGGLARPGERKEINNKK